LAEAGEDEGVLGAAGEEFGEGLGELERRTGPVGPIGVGGIGEVEELEGLGESGVELVEELVAGMGEGGGKVEPAVAAAKPAALAVTVETEVGAGVGGGEEGFPEAARAGGEFDGLAPGVFEDFPGGQAEDELFGFGKGGRGGEEEGAAGEHHCRR
jgi:hypothetical protein